MSTLTKGAAAIKAAAKSKPKKTKTVNGMNGPHRPKLLGANVEIEVHKVFKSLANELETSIQKLVAEAINDLLAKHRIGVRTAIE